MQHHTPSLYNLSLCSVFLYYLVPVSFLLSFGAECGEYFIWLKARENVLVLFAIPHSLTTAPSFQIMTWQTESPPAERHSTFSRLLSQLFCLPHCENVIRMIPLCLKSSFPECALHAALSHFVIRQAGSFVLKLSCLFFINFNSPVIKDNIPHFFLFILIWCFNPVYSYFQLFYQNSVSAQK